MAAASVITAADFVSFLKIILPKHCPASSSGASVQGPHEDLPRIYGAALERLNDSPQLRWLRIIFMLQTQNECCDALDLSAGYPVIGHEAAARAQKDLDRKFSRRGHSI